MGQKKWIIQVFIISFLLAALFSGVSTLLSDLNVLVLTIIIIVVISIGIIFDMIGVATLTCNEAPFHARRAKKQKSAASAIKLLKNSEKVSSICNDIVGDICGIVSGSLGAALTTYIIIKYSINPVLVTILVTSFISSLTVGGKAIFKSVATKKSDAIIATVGKVMYFLNFR